MIQKFVLAFCVGFLASCTTIETTPPAPDREAAWQLHHQALRDLKQWDLNGRVAGKAQEEGFRTDVSWQQVMDAYQIDLKGPFGRTLARISGSKCSVQLVTTEGQTFTAQDPEELTTQVFGFRLPVSGLRYWVLGIPDPNKQVSTQQLDQYGRLEKFSQEGWLIKYQRYKDRAGIVLPEMFSISNATVQATVLIDNWQIKKERL